MTKSRLTVAPWRSEPTPAFELASVAILLDRPQDGPIRARSAMPRVRVVGRGLSDPTDILVEQGPRHYVLVKQNELVPVVPLRLTLSMQITERNVA
jgi:hypothetical protein